MDEINFLRKKYFVTPDKMVCEVKDNFTFDEVVKLLREYTEYQASSHKQVVSGKRPCTCVEQVTQQMVNDIIEWAKNYPAACASGAQAKRGRACNCTPDTLRKDLCQECYRTLYGNEI